MFTCYNVSVVGLMVCNIWNYLCQNILSAMQRVIKGKTSLFIAHRLSTIVDAKEIFVLGDGGVIESGSHSQLITRPHSLYAELWAKQNAALVKEKSHP